MTLILFLDERDGMLFGGRRQSRDRKAREYILRLAEGKRLLMNEYSKKQFTEPAEITVLPDPLATAVEEDYVLIENLPPSTQKADEVLLFLWNRHYPSDVRFDRTHLAPFVLVKTDEFVGHSHEKITVETYRRR